MIADINKCQLVIFNLKKFQERFNDDNFVKDNEKNSRMNYYEFLSSDDKDLRSYLNKILETSDFLYQKYLLYKEEYYNDEKGEKLNREEENGKTSFYSRNRSSIPSTKY